MRKKLSLSCELLLLHSPSLWLSFEFFPAKKTFFLKYPCYFIPQWFNKIFQGLRHTWIRFRFFLSKTKLFSFLFSIPATQFFRRLFHKIFRGLHHLSQLLTIQHFWSTNSNFTTSKIWREIWLPFLVLSKILKNLNLRTHVISKNFVDKKFLKIHIFNAPSIFYTYIIFWDLFSKLT